MDTLVKRLQADYPALQFESGNMFCWSPKQQSVVFKSTDDDDLVAVWSLFHEVGHALLGHHNYASDFELLKLEVEAWTRAEELAQIYNYQIDADHIQDCLDTYRDWLYQRSTCPTCTNTSLQSDAKTYTCFNCSTTWHVSGSRMCRPYRRLASASRQ